MKYALLGNNDLALACFRALVAAGWSPALIFANRSVGSDAEPYESVCALAEREEIQVMQPQDVNASNVVDLISQLAPDMILSVGFHQKLRAPLLTCPKLGCINIHPSLLPRYRGRHPLNWVLVNGETETGLTIHYMDEGFDTGDIISQLRVPIDEGDTARTLQDKFVKLCPSLVVQTVSQLADGSAIRTPQDPAIASYYPVRTKADGVIHWDASARSIYNLVRAITRPYPGAWTPFRGGQLIVWWSEVIPGGSGSPPPGTVVSTAGRGVVVQTGDSRLILTDYQLVGADTQVTVGMRLGTDA